MTTVLDLGGQVAEALRRYVERNPESRRLHEERARFMPGGNTRTVIHVDPFPLTVVRGDGARIVDADGHEYLDFLGEYTAGLYGHSHPAIVQAIRDALADGIVLGAPNVYEGGLAAAVCERFPSIELVRFCNSGTEANLLALSLARVASRKPAVMVFEGAYHGGVFFFKDGDAPLNAPFRYLVGRYNDPEAAARQIAEHAHELAAVIVEPVQGSGGVIPGEPEFLHALREATAATEVLLVFDEVMTSRLSRGGLQETLGIRPDLTTLGKYVGGGLACGAFGGPADLMARFDPARPDAHALGDRLRRRLNGFATEHGLDFCATGRGSMVGLHFTRGPVRRTADSPAAPELRTLLHLHMLDRGYSFARRGFVALSLPLTQSDVDGFARAVEEFLAGH